MKLPPDLHVLVTRPESFGTLLCDKIRALGAVATLFPTLEIHPFPDKAQIQYKEALETARYCLVVSPNAVFCLAPSLMECLASRQHNDLNSFHLISMGESTTRALEKRGLRVTHTPPLGTVSESLLDSPLFDKKRIENTKVVIITGKGGRTLIPETLEARGAKVILCEIYDRQCPRVEGQEALDAWKKAKVNVVLATSQNSLDNLLQLIGSDGKSWLYNQSLLVVSSRLAEYAKALGFSNIVIAKSASDGSIIEALAMFQGVLQTQAE